MFNTVSLQHFISQKGSLKKQPTFNGRVISHSNQPLINVGDVFQKTDIKYTNPCNKQNNVLERLSFRGNKIIPAGRTTLIDKTTGKPVEAVLTRDVDGNNTTIKMFVNNTQVGSIDLEYIQRDLKKLPSSRFDLGHIKVKQISLLKDEIYPDSLNKLLLVAVNESGFKNTSCKGNVILDISKDFYKGPDEDSLIPTLFNLGFITNERGSLNDIDNDLLSQWTQWYKNIRNNISSNKMVLYLTEPKINKYLGLLYKNPILQRPVEEINKCKQARYGSVKEIEANKIGYVKLRDKYQPDKYSFLPVTKKVESGSTELTIYDNNSEVIGWTNIESFANDIAYSFSLPPGRYAYINGLFGNNAEDGIPSNYSGIGTNLTKLYINECMQDPECKGIMLHAGFDAATFHYKFGFRSNIKDIGRMNYLLNFIIDNSEHEGVKPFLDKLNAMLKRVNDLNTKDPETQAKLADDFNNLINEMLESAIKHGQTAVDIGMYHIDLPMMMTREMIKSNPEYKDINNLLLQK